MTRYFYIIIVLILLSSVNASQWKLTFSDEFDYTGLPDPNKWGYEKGFIRNNESQYYTDARKENARIEDGMLIIEAIKEKYPNPSYDPNSQNRRGRRTPAFAEYTSASLVTLGRESFLYGRIEVRAKVPTGRGTWPAIWMLGTNIRQAGWPACGEIDIMENVGFDPNNIHGNIHTQAYNHTRGTNKGATVKINEPYDSFHTYAIEWFEDHIDFFIDDNKYFTFKNEGTGNAVWPYDKPFYLILNLAIGGDWGGQKGIDDTIFPQKYYIDYVRGYEEVQPDR
ncbi:MAG: glycoside hydrolase family 16 protein [Sedimentisphaerales bacterium]